jgi:peptide/nickel transport system substrate-binding protein
MRKAYKLTSLLLVIVTLLAACSTPTPEVVEVTVEKVVTEVVKETIVVEEPAEIVEKVVTATPPPGAKYNESPVLANLVDRDKLPPVDQRLPANPMVIEPLVEQGQYGGNLRFGFVGGSAAWGGLLYLAGWEHLVTWTPDFNSIEPNIVAGWDISDDATEYTFYLRKGMKWSDGDPYDADDIMFYINDVLGNEELFPGGIGADWLPSDMSEGFKVEKIDDYTVKFIFPKPYGTFLYQLATWAGRQFTQYPKHYLEQFHADYNPDIDELIAADDNAEDWPALFLQKAPGTWGDPQAFFDSTDLPSMGPWITTQPLGTGTTILLERNPYYWKVDTQGNQLPYMDGIIGTSYQDAESRTFEMMNGDLDWIKDPGEPNREIYFDALDEGKPIKIISTRPDGGNTQSIHFNLTVEDPVKNEIFNNLDFRIGMSHALNRAELIEVIFKGQGEPAQVAPLESSPLYNEQLATQYLEYDVDLANEYLDKVLPQTDSEGYRLDPEGNRLSIIFTVVNDFSYGAHYEEIAELMIGYWKEVGVEVLMNSVTDAVWNEQRERNEVEMFLFHGGEGGAGITAIIDPRWHVPGEHWGIFGLGWTLWGDGENVENEHAVEPPEYVKDIQDMYSNAIQQPSLEGQIREMQKVMQASADNFWVIGVSRPGLSYQPMSQRLENVPEGYWDGWLEGVHKIVRPEQWYLK